MSMLVKSLWYTSTIVPHQPFILSSIKQNITYKTKSKRRNRWERRGRRRRIHISLFFLVYNISIDLCLEVHSFFLLNRSVFTRHPPPSPSLLLPPPPSSSVSRPPHRSPSPLFFLLYLSLTSASSKFKLP